MKTKTFDCVEMKHRAQERMRAALKGCSREEELAFFRRGAEEFKKHVKSAKQGLETNTQRD